jgi:putative ATP-binding cassette transporter
MKAGMFTLDRVTRKRVAQVVRSFRKTDEGGKGTRLFVLLLILMIAINGLNVLNSYVGRDFMSSMENRDAAAFVRLAVLYVVVFGVSTAVAVYFRFSEERLGLLWRESLTRQLSDAYLDHCLQPHGSTPERVANPDQRISEDVRAFTTSTMTFALLILNGTFTILAFSGVLWSISPLLFVVAVGYAAIGSLMTIRLGRPLIGLNFRQADKEANFRSELIHVRDHAEQVALTHNEPLFRRRLSQRIGDWASNGRKIIAVNRNLSFFTTGYNYLIQLIPALVVAPMFFRGQIEFGVITQSAMAFATLLGAFSIIVTQFQSISTFAAVVARLSELAMSIERASEPVVTPVTIRHEPRRLEFEGLEVFALESGTPLIRGLDFLMPERASVLIQGPNEAARHAVFHLLSGRWERGSGTVVMPDPSRMMLLPERPYLPPGTLRQLLRIETGDVRVNDLRTSQALRLLKLGEVIERVGGLDVVRDWGEMLSLGEQQLFACVRAIAANPDFIVFDRPGTTLKDAELARVIGSFRQMGQGSLMFGGTGESSAPFDAVLQIQLDGTWSYTPQIRALPEAAIEESSQCEFHGTVGGDGVINPEGAQQGGAGGGQPDQDAAAG